MRKSGVWEEYLVIREASGNSSCIFSAVVEQAETSDPRGGIDVDFDSAASCLFLGVSSTDQGQVVALQPADILDGEAHVPVDPHQFVEVSGQGVGGEAAAGLVNGGMAIEPPDLGACQFELPGPLLGLGFDRVLDEDENDVGGYGNCQS